MIAQHLIKLPSPKIKHGLSRTLELLKECKLYDYWKDDPEIKKLEKGK